MLSLDAADLKAASPRECGFESRRPHQGLSIVSLGFQRALAFIAGSAVARPAIELSDRGGPHGLVWACAAYALVGPPAAAAESRVRITAL